MGSHEEPAVQRRTAPFKAEKILGSKADKILGSERKANVESTQVVDPSIDHVKRSCPGAFFLASAITTGIVAALLSGLSIYHTGTLFFKQDDIVWGKLNSFKKVYISSMINGIEGQIRTRLALDRQFTPEELERHSGIDESLPVYLSFHRHVFDVSAGRSFYARGSGSYGNFGGRDATRAFITGEFVHDLTCDLTGLTDEQIAEGVDHWLNFYKNHDEYFQVGVLAYDHECPKALTPEELEAAKEKSKQAQEKAQDEELVEAEEGKGNEAAGDDDEAKERERIVDAAMEDLNEQLEILNGRT